MNPSNSTTETALPLPPSRFELGSVVATPGALAAMERSGQGGTEFLNRHQHGGWGEVCADDAKANEASVTSDARLLSAYRLMDQTRIWVITESDRSSTCILLPEEY